MKISVAHATRRPRQALAIRQVWLEAAAHPENVEWIFGIDADDPESLEVLAGEPHTVSPAGLGGVRAFNDAAKCCTGDYIIGGCDDFYPIPRWDEVIAERLGDPKQPRVLLTDDGVRKDRLATLLIITRAWYERFNFFLPPQFKTVGPDVWMTERASRDGQLVNAMDLVFEHRHAFYKKAPMDAVYEKQNDPERYREMETILDELLEPLPISLCMIVGNEASVIRRCLESAKGAFDELCLVRAIGEQVADNTVDLALDWCRQNGKRFSFAEYYNLRSGLDHVDNFAAARNQAFSLATSYWCFWLDADDLLDDLNCRRIRTSSGNTRFEAQCFRYLMPTGGEYYRERLIKRGSSSWKYPVHEVCVIRGDACTVPQIEIRHAPIRNKEQSSSSRNLAILEKSDPTENPRHWFYLHEELLRSGDKGRALTAGIHAFSVMGHDFPVESYEICLNLATLEDPEKWCLEAVRIDPLRREALAELVQHNLAIGDLARAAQYFKWMDTIGEPKPRPWTHRQIWHGWARNYLRVKILRATGKHDEAASDHSRYLQDPIYASSVAELEAFV